MDKIRSAPKTPQTTLLGSVIPGTRSDPDIPAIGGLSDCQFRARPVTRKLRGGQLSGGLTMADLL